MAEYQIEKRDAGFFRWRVVEVRYYSGNRTLKRFLSHRGAQRYIARLTWKSSSDVDTRVDPV